MSARFKVTFLKYPTRWSRLGLEAGMPEALPPEFFGTAEEAAVRRAAAEAADPRVTATVTDLEKTPKEWVI